MLLDLRREIEREGLVERQSCPGDRRSFYVHLTGEGAAMLERMWPVYARGVADDFLPALDIVMLVSIGLIEFFRCMNVLSNAHATLVARDPVPVVPESGPGCSSARGVSSERLRVDK